jgi:hypothetical protein
VKFVGLPFEIKAKEPASKTRNSIRVILYIRYRLQMSDPFKNIGGLSKKKMVSLLMQLV